MMQHLPYYLLFALGLVSMQCQAQRPQYKISAEASVSDGRTPLWLNANKYGLSSLEKNNAFLDAGIVKPDSMDSKWGWSAGAEMAVAYHNTSTVIVQQAYVEGRWLHGTLTLGSKEWPMQMKNNRLSSGSQTLGINARPVPQLRIALPEYTKLTKWLYLKGHIAYGFFTDDNWQQDFSNGKATHCEDIRYHSKAGYFRIGVPEKPLTVELGVEMAAQFGGKKYDSNGQLLKTRPHDISDYWNVFWGGGGDPGEGVFANADGNQMGSWLVRINWNKPQYAVSFYIDHYFDDHSQMFFLDYDGYGEGEEWNEKKKSHYFRYKLKDNMYGIEVELKKISWLRHIVGEYLYTKYQSGPIYHDHGTLVSYHIGGDDDYMNHGFYGSWQHWGQVMGNPLYRSPLYNKDGKIRVESNRFWALHFGCDGNLSRCLDYRLLISAQKSWGSYKDPFVPIRKALNVMAEFNYQLKRGYAVGCAVGLDRGSVFGDNFGLQIRFSKSGIL